MFPKVAFLLIGLAVLHAASRHGHGHWRSLHDEGADEPGPREHRVPPFFAEWHRRAHAAETVQM